MNDRLREAFEPIRITDEMKQDMSAFLLGELSKRQRKVRNSARYAFVCFAVFFLMIGGIGGYSFYLAPVSYISVDVNPSFELGLNHFDRVVTVAAYNDDGTAVLQNLKLKNKPYTEAVELLLADKTFESYLSEDSFLSFTVVSDKEKALLSGIQLCRGYPQANVECRSANTALMAAARQSGLSFGKYQAFLELSKYDKTITAEDCKGLSMRQIRSLISQCAKGGDNTDMPNGQGRHGGRQGSGNGNGYHGAKPGNRSGINHAIAGP